MIERRREPRISQRLETRFSRGGKTCERSGFSANVGPDGLFVVARAPEPRGVKLGLEVSLPDGGIASLVGEVAWTRATPPRRRFAGRRGFGVRIITATETWHEFAAALSVA